MEALSGGLAREHRVSLDGKFFAAGGSRFRARGVTYGTFRPRQDGALYPPTGRVDADFSAMRSAGFNTVRTYTEPPADVLERAADHGLRLLAGVFYPDWRYLIGHSHRDLRRLRRTARDEVRRAVSALAGRPEVLGVAIANEIPADAVRWFGHRRLGRTLEDLVEAAHEIDPEMLVTAGAYPTAEYLTVENLDFITFNVYLDHPEDFRRYLTRLHHLAGDRPLVLGELGRHAGQGSEGEALQAEALDWQLSTTLERGAAGTFVFSWTDEWNVGGADVEGWSFGLVRADRSPRPALATASRWNTRNVADLDFAWPSISVVVCGYNAAETLDECLSHACALDYPGLEVIVVDDGSTDATAAVAALHPRAKLVRIAHAGLSAARNAGIAAASGELVAFLDADAYPCPEWPYYLALGLDRSDVGGVGGPNLAPSTDPRGAQAVAHAPGGPVHVLLSDDRAEHIPGCNMAFWRETLDSVGCFDPVYTAAGDDVDVCWKVIERGWSIAFHPAAVVWHHRRSGTRTYLRQQRGYGRAEALVAARHPDRVTALGTARWRGFIYDAFPVRSGRQPIYRGLFGVAAYQSVYRKSGHALDVLHQAGVPLAVAALPAALFLPAAPTNSLARLFAVTGIIAAAFIVGLFCIDLVRVRVPRQFHRGAVRFRAHVAVLHILQPFVRWLGRDGKEREAVRGLAQPAPLPGPVSRRSGGTLLIACDRPRAEVATLVVGHLRRAGFRVQAPTGWEDSDCTVVESMLVRTEVVSSAHLPGWVQIRARLRPRARQLLAVPALVALAAALAPPLAPPLAVVVVVVVGVEAARGWWAHLRVGMVVERAAKPPVPVAVRLVEASSG